MTSQAAMLTARQVAALLGIKPRTVYDIPAEKLPRYHLGAKGGAVRYRPEDVEAYRASCRSTGTSAPDDGNSNSITASTGNALASVAFFPLGGRERKPMPTTARKARPCTRSRPASPSLGTSLTKLSVVT